MFKIIILISLLSYPMLEATQSEYALSIPQVPEEIHTIFKQSPEISSKHVFLEDVLTCEGNNIVCDEILNIHLGKAPHPGTKERIDCQIVSNIIDIETNYNINLSCGQDKVTSTSFSSKTTKIDKDFIRQVLSSRLSESMNIPKGEKVFIETLSTTANPQSFYHKPKIRFPDLIQKKGILKQGRSTKLKMLIDDIFNYSFNVRIGFMLRVVSASKPILKNTLLSNNDLTYKFIKSSLAKGRSFRSPTTIIGKFSKSFIPEGSVITPAKIYRKKAVVRGNKVTTTISNQHLRIESYATALKSGSIGDSIPIKLTSTGKSSLAIVTGVNKVRINL